MEAASNSNLQTFSGWLVGDGALFGSNATGNGQFHLRASLFGNSLTYRVSYFSGNSGETDNTVTVTPLSINNIVVVKKDVLKYDVYFNGLKVMNQVIKQATVSTNFWPGFYYSGAYNLGNVLNYLIYNRALTSAEILQNFNATKSRYGL